MIRKRISSGKYWGRYWRGAGAATLLLALTAFAPSAFAQALSLILAPPSGTVQAGGAPLVFSGSLTNLGTTAVTIDGSSFVVLPDTPGISVFDNVDFIDFLIGGGVLNPGESYTGSLFDLNADASVGAGQIDGTATYSGTYTDPVSGDPTSLFAPAAFQVTVNSGGGASIPEPGTLALLFPLAAGGVLIYAAGRSRS